MEMEMEMTKRMDPAESYFEFDEENAFENHPSMQDLRLYNESNAKVVYSFIRFQYTSLIMCILFLGCFCYELQIRFTEFVIHDASIRLANESAKAIHEQQYRAKVGTIIISIVFSFIGIMVACICLYGFINNAFAYTTIVISQRWYTNIFYAIYVAYLLPLCLFRARSSTPLSIIQIFSYCWIIFGLNTLWKMFLYELSNYKITRHWIEVRTKLDIQYIQKKIVELETELQSSRTMLHDRQTFLHEYDNDTLSPMCAKYVESIKMDRIDHLNKSTIKCEPIKIYY